MDDSVIHSSHHIVATVNYRSGKKEKAQTLKNELVPQHVNSRLSKRSAIVRAHCNRFLSENN